MSPKNQKNNILEAKGRVSNRKQTLEIDVRRNETCFVLSPLKNLVNICERNSEDGSLKKTNKATNILFSFKTYLGEEGNTETKGEIGLREFL